MKRPRVNTRGLVSHCSPLGKAHKGRQDYLKSKFDKGEITPEELREYAELVHKTNTPAKEEVRTFYITVWGKQIKVTKAEYEAHCQGF